MCHLEISRLHTCLLLHINASSMAVFLMVSMALGMCTENAECCLNLCAFKVSDFMNYGPSHDSGSQW
jgi:hypothetical protein